MSFPFSLASILKFWHSLFKNNDEGVAFVYIDLRVSSYLFVSFEEEILGACQVGGPL